VIDTNDIVDAVEDELYRVEYQAHDIDPTSDVLHWTLSTNASFLSLGLSTGILSGTPANEDVGKFRVNITVADDKGGTTSHEFMLQVHNVNDPPVALSPSIEIIMEEDSRFNSSTSLFGMFKDIDHTAMLSFQASLSDNFTITINQTDGTFTIAPEPDWNGHENITVFANDSYSQDLVVLNMNVTPVNDKPDGVEIFYPETGAQYFKNQTIVLSGRAVDPDISREGDDLVFAWSSNISGALGQGETISIESLSVGRHTISLSVSDSHHAEAVTSIEIVVIPLPEVHLISPVSGLGISRSFITLSWQLLDNPNGPLESDIEYRIYIGTTKNATSLLARVSGVDNYTISSLTERTTYFWTVLPFLNDIGGRCISGIWNFTIRRPPIYNMSIELNTTEIQAQPGDVIVLTLIIRNSGTRKDTYYLSNSNDIGNSVIIDLEPGSLTIPFERNDTSTITIKLPVGVTPGNYTITVMVVGTNISQEEVLHIMILSLGTGPGDTDNNGPADGKSTPGKQSGSTYIWIVLLIVLILTGIAAGLIIYRRSQNHTDISPEEPDIPGHVGQKHDPIVPDIVDTSRQLFEAKKLHRIARPASESTEIIDINPLGEQPLLENQYPHTRPLSSSKNYEVDPDLFALANQFGPSASKDPSSNLDEFFKLEPIKKKPEKNNLVVKNK